jgi:hypothetical protein
VTAVVFNLRVRLETIPLALLYGGLVLLGLIAATRRLIKGRSLSKSAQVQIVELALLALCVSWFAWYVLLSIGWPRYLFPAVFVGSLFAAVWLADLIGPLLKCQWSEIRSRSLFMRLCTYLVAGVVVLTSIYSVVNVVSILILGKSDAAQHTAQWIDEQPQSRLVETYESELFFFLNHPYHYPPDQLHVDLNYQYFLREMDSPVRYDPLAADPDYLVVGPFSRMWRLYDTVLSTAAFRKVQSFGEYDIYERVRSN